MAQVVMLPGYLFIFIKFKPDFDVSTIRLTELNLFVNQLKESAGARQSIGHTSAPGSSICAASPTSPVATPLRTASPASPMATPAPATAKPQPNLVERLQRNKAVDTNDHNTAENIVQVEETDARSPSAFGSAAPAPTNGVPTFMVTIVDQKHWGSLNNGLAMHVFLPRCKLIMRN